MRYPLRLAALLALVTFVQVSALLAQQGGQQPSSGQQSQQPARPFRGLFGGSGADPDSHQALNLTFTASGGYDDNMYAPGGIAPVDPTSQLGGTYTDFQAALDYVRRGRHLSFSAGGGSGYRYYPDLVGLNGATPWASAGLSGSLSAHTTFSVSGGASYSPYYGFGVFPGLAASETAGQAAASRVDRALFLEPSFLYTASGALEHQLGPRSAVSATYSLRYTDFRSEQRSLKDQVIGVRFTRSLGRTLGIRFGYLYHDGNYGYLGSVGVPFKGHDLDVGVDYNRALDRSRRTTFGFSTGSAIIVTPLDNYYRLLGSAFLNRAIGRSWNLRADYRRGVQFVEGFARPFFVDAVSAGARGFIGARVEVYGSGGYSDGELGFGGPAQNFATYTGNAGVRVALVRYVALNVDYLFYHYVFDQSTPLPPGVSPGLDRNGIRAGMTVWLPLLR